MSKIRSILLTLIAAGMAISLSGCKLALLNPQGIIAADEKHIMIIATLLMLVVVVPVILLTFFVAWRYREGNTKAKYSPEWSHSTALEIVWWTIPCVIISILAYITWTSSYHLDPYKPLAATKEEDTITIQAISLDWKWLFIYPDQDIATINYVQFPVGVPVKFLISSEGPMNSFQIPQLAGQIYAMAGMQTKLHLIADHAGDYQGFSANFSGNGFSDMRFAAKASTKEEFDAWVKTVKQSHDKLTMVSYKELAKPSEKNPVQYFSSTNKEIFVAVTMKSMMPMPMQDEESKQKLAVSLKK